MIYIRQANVKDAISIQELAARIWYPTYGPIISPEQIRYMLSHIYDLNSLTNQIAHNLQTYLLACENEQAVGFASYSVRKENPEVFKLHKLYCLVETQGKGYGKALLKAVEERVIENGKSILELNVNRYNPAKTFYEKMGYEVIYEEDIPIGEYWMNDYVMRKVLG